MKKIIQEYRDKSVAELRQNLLNLRKEQFNLRMQKQMGQSPKANLVRAARRNIARIKTILQEKVV